MPRATCAAVGRRLAAIFCAAVVHGPLRAAEVSIDVSSQEVYGNVPFTVGIAIENATTYDPPRLPEVDGLRVEARLPPMTSSFTEIINGRISKRDTVTFRYRLVAERPGTFTIPPVAVTADGAELRTKAVRIVASDTETTDLLFVDVRAERDVYYLGERIELALEIWLRPYRDRNRQLSFDERDMFRQVSQTSSYGVFADGLREIKVREGLRPDREGVERGYFVYSIAGSVTPQQTGELTFDDVRILVNYPEQVQRSRGFFDSGWETVRARPLVAAVEHAPIRIVAPPDEGRPAGFAGAVGRFDFQVRAGPVDVAVGDPITLTMAIRDRTSGGADLQLLQPPPLDSIPELARDFRVPTDPLAGVVENNRKTFTQTIRPRNEAVTRIPPIPFSFFDPGEERNVTVSSSPIELVVHPASVLSDAEIIGADPARLAPVTELTEVAGGIDANYTGAALLLSSHAFTPGWAHGVLIGAPPLLFAAGALGLRRSRRLAGDRGYARRRSAKRLAMRRLAQAAGAGGASEAAAIGSAVCDYVADRCNLPAGALTSAEVVERLRRGAVTPGLVEDLQTLLNHCEELRYAGAPETGSDSIGERAASCIGRLEKERIA